MKLNYLEDYWPCADEFSAMNVIGTQVARPPDKLGIDPMAYYGGINKRSFSLCSADHEQVWQTYPFERPV